MKYRYVITNEGTVEADTTAEAELAAFEALERGSGIYICTIEPLPAPTTTPVRPREAREK